MPFVYPFVGPGSLLVTARSQGARGRVVDGDRVSLRRWLFATPDALREGVTFTLGVDEVLRLAPRRSEHVACAGGLEVLAAGELQFLLDGANAVVSAASNQSTGYCPDVDTWPEVERALQRCGLPGPDRYTTPIVFRRCIACGACALVKEAWFVCALCDASLPQVWNVSARRWVSRPG